MRLLAATLLAAFAVTGCDQLDEWEANRTAQAEARAQQAKRDAQLTYATNSWRWSYLNDGNVQYHVSNNQMYLRQIRSDDHFVQAYMDQEGFNASAYWKAPCEVGKVIPLSITGGNGDAFTLNCKRLGGFTWAYVGVNWSRDSEPQHWVRDFDGFKVNVDFSYWDWSKAKQYATLQKAAASE